MQSKASTIEEYLAGLPEERRDAVARVHAYLLKRLPKGYEAAVQHGIISYVVPLALYPKGYCGKKHVPLPYLSLGLQKNYLSLYFMSAYMDPEIWAALEAGIKASGAKASMGKCCVRFKKAEDIPLKLIGDIAADMSVKKYVALYEAGRNSAGSGQPRRARKQG